MHRRRFLGSVGALSALSGCTVAESVVTGFQEGWESGQGKSDGDEYPSREAHAEALIHEMTNERRREAGLHELERNEQLDEVAQYHSDDMAERDYYAHTSPNGETLRMRFAKFDVRCVGGENLMKHRRSYGVDPVSTANAAIGGWMESPGHRRNLLRARYEIVGIGVVIKERVSYVTQNFC